MSKAKKWSLKDQIEHGKFLLRNRDAIIDTYERIIATHGGKRKGSGRPKKEPTKEMRIPVSKIQAVQKLIKP